MQYKIKTFRQYNQYPYYFDYIILIDKIYLKSPISHPQILNHLHPNHLDQNYIIKNLTQKQKMKMILPHLLNKSLILLNCLMDSLKILDIVSNLSYIYHTCIQMNNSLLKWEGKTEILLQKNQDQNNLNDKVHLNVKLENPFFNHNLIKNIRNLQKNSSPISSKSIRTKTQSKLSFLQIIEIKPATTKEQQLRRASSFTSAKQKLFKILTEK